MKNGRPCNRKKLKSGTFLFDNRFYFEKKLRPDQYSGLHFLLSFFLIWPLYDAGKASAKPKQIGLITFAHVLWNKLKLMVFPEI